MTDITDNRSIEFEDFLEDITDGSSPVTGEFLSFGRIFSIYRDTVGFIIQESCDNCFAVRMDARQLRKLGETIIAIADEHSPNKEDIQPSQEKYHD